jgi:adenylylsulfate kinase
MKEDQQQGEGFALWMTGLPASGKSTLARAVAERLRERGLEVQILDSDSLRAVLTPEPSYTREERDWFYRVMVYLGTLLANHGINVIFAATAHRRRYRDRARKAFSRFAEVHLACPLEVCMARDEKGIYEKARRGEADTVPGLQVPYEAPAHPEVVVYPAESSPREAAEDVLRQLKEGAFFRK